MSMRSLPGAAVAAFVLAAAVLTGASSRASVDRTQVLASVADGYVQADRPQRGYGAAPRLTISSRPITRAYIRFRLAPRAQPMRRALLRVWAHNRAPAGFRVRLAGNAWRERSLTFTRSPKPARRGVASGPVRRGWKHVDVTRLIPRAGSTVTFVLSTTSRARLVLASREVGSRGPRLQVTPRPPAGSVVLAGAGDIAYDGPEDGQTAALLDAIDPDIVFTLGDNAYEEGTARQFATWYRPTWGRFRARTRPTPGNHDYRTRNASGYFGYFGARAGEPAKGYYSYEAGAWHVVVLNTNGEGACATIACNGGSAQERWLRADLAASTKQCTLAYWHHPRYSIGPQGTTSVTRALWEALYDDGVELALAGNDHNYQRWKPLDDDGEVDAAEGIRSFVVGTGGKTPDGFGSHPNVEIANAGTPGVLKLTLEQGGYDWQFVPVAGKTFTDSGSGTCH
jgi:hypothetical protein